MKVLITGARGFIGSNLAAQLAVRGDFEILRYCRETPPGDLSELVSAADYICHLAGVNRSTDPTKFTAVNRDLTASLCQAVAASGRRTPTIFASSAHAGRNDPYGSSKREAEELLLRHAEQTGIPVHIFRLSQVIGKWCRPNYNSVVATFCHNIARDIPITIDDPAYQLNLLYIDDVVESFARLMTGEESCGRHCEVAPSYPTTVGEIANTLRGFRASRDSLLLDGVGMGLTRALYATYVSYLMPKDFVYTLRKQSDARGEFAEVLKTGATGQFSFFTAPPGVTRGGHYHHSKVEKFLVLKGQARFRFRQILSGESHELVVTGVTPEIVETVPGWAHDLTNVGSEDLIVMLWANELFDPIRPDTYEASF